MLRVLRHKLVKKQGRRTRRLNRRSTIFVLVIVMTLVGICLWLVMPWLQARLFTTSPPPANNIVRESTNQPDERSIPHDTSYEVPADQPRQLRLPSLDKTMFIQQVGVDKQHKIAVPTNINLVGWYVGSAKPGKPGVSIIDGHVSGRYNRGIFHDLHKLKKGDKVIVQYGNKSEKTFTVRTLQTIPEKQAALLMSKLQPGSFSQLNLITCVYDAKSKSFPDRLIVTATLDVAPIKLHDLLKRHNLLLPSLRKN